MDKTSAESDIEEFQIYPSGARTCISRHSDYNCDINTDDECTALDSLGAEAICTMENDECLLSDDTLICERTYEDASRFNSYFNRMAPKGKFLIKDVHGVTIDQEIEGVQELADAIISTTDYYACGVRNYFYFLVGDKIDLFYADATDVNNEVFNLTTLEREKQSFIINLGEMLKNDSSKTMQDAWKEIIKSDYFLESIIGTNVSAEEIELDAPTEGTIEYYFKGLSDCAGCHATAKNNVPAYAASYNASETCEDQKTFLKNLNTYSWFDSLSGAEKTLIGAGSTDEEILCNSRIYSVQEDSYESTSDCANYAESNDAGFMNGDVDLIKSFIENFDDIDSMECE